MEKDEIKDFINVSFFIRKWYREYLYDFVNNYGLIYPNEKENLGGLSNYHNINNGILFAASKNFSYFDESEPSLVIGGPCFSDCYDSMTFETAIDILNVIEVSKLLNTKGIVYLGVEEEYLKDNTKDWGAVGDVIEDYVRRCCDLKKYHNIGVIRTDSEDIKREMKIFSNIVEENTSKVDLDNLYRFRSYRNNLSTSKDEKHYKACINTITTYLPAFINKITGGNKKNIIVSENSHQLRAVRSATRINKKLFLEYEDSGPFHLIHLPVPDRSGDDRMYRSIPSKKIFLNEEDEIMNRKVTKAKKRVLECWLNVLPPEIRKEKETRDTFIDYIHLLNNI